MDRENSTNSCTYKEENQDPYKNLSTPKNLDKLDDVGSTFDSGDEDDQVLLCTPPVSSRAPSPGAINPYLPRHRSNSVVIIEQGPFIPHDSVTNRATLIEVDETPCTPPVRNRLPSPGAIDHYGTRNLRPFLSSVPIAFRVPDFPESSESFRAVKKNGLSLFGNSSKDSDIESPNKNTNSFKQCEPEPSKVYFINVYVLFCWYFIAFIKILVYYKGEAGMGVNEMSVLANFLNIQGIVNMDRLRRFTELVRRNSENKVVIIVPNSANDKSSNICFLIKVILHFLTRQLWNDKNLHVQTVTQLSCQNDMSNCGIKATFSLKLNINPCGYIDSEMWRFEYKVCSVTFGLFNFYDVKGNKDLCFISENFYVSASRYFRVDPLIGVLNLESMVSFMTNLGMSDKFICSALSLTESTLKLGWDLRAFKLTQEQEDEIDEQLEVGLINLSLISSVQPITSQ